MPSTATRPGRAGRGTTRDAPPAPAIDIAEVLESKHQIYVRYEKIWKRDEARLHGGDEVLPEVTRFKYEDDDSYALRLRRARYGNLPDLHSSLLTGHISKTRPTPNYAEMGEVRERGDLAGELTQAELIEYNCDGVGNDGSQLHAWVDAVQRRANATGFRWVLAEMPDKNSLRELRVGLGKTGPALESEEITDDEVQAGFRPYFVEYSPLACTNWKFRNRTLMWAVLRISVDGPLDFGATAPKESELGYYLLVRAGYTGLGPAYEQGGWWKFDHDKTALGHSLWDLTGGQIPLVRAIAAPSDGTYEHPAMARSLTMELGQIAIDLLNARSEQVFNLREAARSAIYILGGDEKSQGEVVDQQNAGSLTIAVKAVMSTDGSTVIVPQIWCSNAAAMDSGAYSVVIDSGVAEAREIMVRQITQDSGQSGEAKQAEFAGSSSPLLAILAASQEQWLNSALYFIARLFGHAKPTVSIQLPRDYRIRDLIDDVDQMLDSLRRAALSSPTWETDLVIRKGDKMDLLPPDTEILEIIDVATGKTVKLKKREVIISELRESARRKQDRAEQAAALFAELENGGPRPPGRPAEEPAPTRPSTPPPGEEDAGGGSGGDGGAGGS